MKSVGGANFNGADQPLKTPEENTSVAARKKKTESPSKAEKAKIEQTNETDKKLAASSTLRGIQSSHPSESPLPMKNKFYAISASSHEASGDIKPQSTETCKKLSSSVATQRFQFPQSQLSHSELKNNATTAEEDFDTAFSLFESKTENEMKSSPHEIKNASAEPSSSNAVANVNYQKVMAEVHSGISRIAPGGSIRFDNVFDPENLKNIFYSKVVVGGIEIGDSLEHETDHKKIKKSLKSSELVFFHDNKLHMMPQNPALDKDGQFRGTITHKNGNVPPDAPANPEVVVLSHEQAALFLAAGAAHIAYLRSLNQETRRTDQDAVDQSVHKDEIKKSVIKNDNGKKEAEHRAITKDATILRPAENLNSRAFSEKLAKRLDKEIKSEQRIFDLEIEKERIKKRRLKDS